jgi:WD40 repeat protein
MPDWDPEANALFLRALDIAAAEDRGRFLDGACAANPALRARVDGLLRAGAEAGSFLEQPLEAPALTSAHVPATAAEPGPTAGTAVGRYKLLEVIGEGGMGTVWMAQQAEPVKRLVALKVIKAGMDSRQVIARFEAERQALALMDHPNIARVFDAGTTSAGRPYFVMELVKGVPLTKFCDERRLPPRQRLELFIQVCQAIQHAHQKGIIHRDIKPSNILVALYDGRPVPKVIDFGVAKATGPQLTDHTLVTGFGAVVGTLQYMSPEQAELNQLDIDTRSDIYSLGVLLYELLTGSTPLEKKRVKEAAMLEVLRLIREEEAPRPSTRLSATDEMPSVAACRGLEPKKLSGVVRGELDWIVMKALDKDRDRRYETANGFAADLQRYLADEPVRACPPSVVYRGRKFARRNKTVLTVATLIAVTVLVASATVTWKWWEAESAGEQERIAKDRAIQGEAQAVAAEQQAVREKKRADEQLGRAESLVYASKLSLAQSAFAEDKGDLALEYLQECQSSLRGWEHRLLWARYNARQTLRGHTRGLNAVAYSPDGKRIVTSSSDNTAKVWDAGTGREILTLPGHTHFVYRVAYSPDGKRIATGSWDKTAKVWDATTGRLLFTLEGHANLICGLAYSPDGKRIVTASGPAIFKKTKTSTSNNTQPGEAKVWDAETGAELFTFARHAWGLLGVAYSPDGGRIVTGNWDMAKVWDARTGREIMPLGSEIGPVAFSPDGKRILTGGWIAKLWDAATGREVFSLKWQRRDPGIVPEVMSVAYSPDGRRIVTGSWDKTVRVWDAERGQEVFSLKGHSAPVMGVAYSPDGRRIVSGSMDLTGRVWDAESGQDPLTFRGTHAFHPTAAFSPDGKRIVTYGMPAFPAKVRDATTGQELLTLDGRPRRPQAGSTLSGVAYSPDGKRIALGVSHYDPPGKDLREEAKVFDSATGKLILSLESHAGGNGNVAYSPDGRRIVTGSRDKTARVWDTETGREIFTPEAFASLVSVGAYSPDGKRIVTGSRDKTPKVRDAATGREIFSLQGHTDEVAGVAFSPDGTRIATGSRDMTVRVWDAATGQEVLTLRGYDKYVQCVAFSPDGERLLTGDWGNQFKLWDAGSASKELPNVYPLPDAAERRRYHTQQADRAEKDKKWFAVVFHVGRLLLDDPQDADLTHRRREALLGRGVLDPHEMRRRGDLRRALAWARKAQAAAPEDAEANNYLAWMLAIFPDPKTRDAKRAVTLAQQAIGARPPSWQHSRTLGLAHHFAGDELEAVKALNTSLKLRGGGGDAFDYFLLAAAHQRLGNKAEARTWYDRAVVWARHNTHPYVAELAVVRADAEAALGIGKQAKPDPLKPPAEK